MGLISLPPPHHPNSPAPFLRSPIYSLSTRYPRGITRTIAWVATIAPMPSCGARTTGGRKAVRTIDEQAICACGRTYWRPPTRPEGRWMRCSSARSPRAHQFGILLELKLGRAVGRSGTSLWRPPRPLLGPVWTVRGGGNHRFKQERADSREAPRLPVFMSSFMSSGFEAAFSVSRNCARLKRYELFSRNNPIANLQGTAFLAFVASK